MAIGVSDEFFGRKRPGFTLAAGGSQAVGSLSFPGGLSSANSGGVRIPRNGGQSINVGAGEFTWEMWIRPSATAADNDNAGVTAGDNYSGVNANLIVDSDRLSLSRAFVFGIYLGQVCFAANNAGGNTTRLGSTDLRDGLWHHVAFYRNATSGLVQLYVDGVREYSNSHFTGDISCPQGAGSGNDIYHYLAVEKAFVEEGFDGDISEMRVTTTQVYSTATYTVPTSPLTAITGTVGLYHFDENTGTTLGDDSGGGNDGTLVGSPVPTWSTADPF